MYIPKWPGYHDNGKPNFDRRAESRRPGYARNGEYLGLEEWELARQRERDYYNEVNHSRSSISISKLNPFPIFTKPTVRNAFKTVGSIAVGYVAFAFITGKQKDLVIEPLVKAAFNTYIFAVSIGYSPDKENQTPEENWRDRQFLWKNRDDIKNYFNEENDQKKDSINDVLQKKKKAARNEKRLKEKETSMLELYDNKTLILFPEHMALQDQENLLNPQWRLQLS